VIERAAFGVRLVQMDVRPSRRAQLAGEVFDGRGRRHVIVRERDRQRRQAYLGERRFSVEAADLEAAAAREPAPLAHQ